MNRSSIVIVVLFSGLLLIPATSQLIISLKNDVPYQPIDMITDMVKTPLKRENQLHQASDSLNKAWKDVSKKQEYNALVLEPALDAFRFLKDTYINVNSYTTMDSSSIKELDLQKIEVLFNQIEEDASVSDSLDNLIQQASSTYGSFSLKRLFDYYWNYGFLTSRYWRSYEARLEEENKVSQKSRKIIQNLFWNVFNEPGEKVFLGENGWLFYRDDVAYLTMPSPLDHNRSKHLDNPVKEIVAFKEDLQKKGIELLVVMVPGKPSIYPEFLNSSWDSSSEPPFTHSKEILKQLNAKGIQTVDLYKPFIEAKKEDQDSNYLYLYTDTHWTPRGAKLAASVVAEKVRSMSFDLPVSYYKEEPISAERVGDIGVMTSLSVFPSQWVQAQQVKDSAGNLFKDNYRHSSILIIGDSFSRIYQTDAPRSAGFISLLAKELNTPLASIVSDGGASTLVRETLSRRSGVLKGKKLVIWEFVERDLRFGAEGWKRISL